MEQYAPYLIVFLCGALLSWVVGYADTRMSHAHKLVVGAAKKTVVPLAQQVAGHEKALANHNARLHNVETKVLGN